MQYKQINQILGPNIYPITTVTPINAKNEVGAVDMVVFVTANDAIDVNIPATMMIPGINKYTNVNYQYFQTIYKHITPYHRILEVHQHLQ